MNNAVYMVSTHGHFDVDPETGRVRTAGLQDTGGQTVYCVEKAKALGAAGQLTFPVTRWFSTIQPELTQLGPNAYLLRLKGGPFEFVRKEKLYQYLPRIADNLIMFIKSRWRQMFADASLEAPESVQPALFHGHYVDGGLVAYEAARQFDAPFFWTSHSLGALKRARMVGDDEEGKGKQYDQEFKFPHRLDEEAHMMEMAARMGGQVVTAKTEPADIRQLYPAENVGGIDPRFIPPGVDVAHFMPGPIDRAKLKGWPKGDEPVVLMGGRFARTKGYAEGLLAAIKALEINGNVNIVLFGGSAQPSFEEGQIMAELERIRTAAGVARRVFFIGGIPQEDLPHYFRAATCFIMPSRFEPFGMVALEAGACGCPIIVSKAAGLAEELHNGVDAIIVDIDDTEAFAQAIANVISDHELAARLGQGALETINGRYSWQGIAARHIDFWRSKGANV